MDDLDALVRRADPDRWLSSRFITDEAARADVVALYAFDHELERVAKVTSQPLIGEMRLTWWADAIAEIFEGRPVRRHPVALAIAQAVDRRKLPRPPFDAAIDARMPELDGAAPDRLASETAIMGLALQVLGAPDARQEAAARAWAARSAEPLGQANADLRALPSAAFPAVAYATLVRAPKASAVGKRMRLAWAVLRGLV